MREFIKKKMKMPKLISARDGLVKKCIKLHMKIWPLKLQIVISALLETKFGNLIKKQWVTNEIEDIFR